MKSNTAIWFKKGLTIADENWREIYFANLAGSPEFVKKIGIDCRTRRSSSDILFSASYADVFITMPMMQVIYREILCFAQEINEIANAVDSDD